MTMASPSLVLYIRRAWRNGDGIVLVLYFLHMSKTWRIIVIGNEILSGKTIDENSLFLTRELRSLGVDVRKISVIPDELSAIGDEVRLFSRSFDYVFTTGGVG